MIIDQLFEDDKKKKLNEVDPRNFDSDEDYYDAVRRSRRGSSDDDYDYDPDLDDIDDEGDDESYYEKYVRTKNLEESRRLNESMLMEDPVYRNFKRVGQFIVERELNRDQVLDMFAQVEAGMTDKATGANRTALGRGKDKVAKFAGDVSGAVKGILNGMQESAPMQAVEVAYDQATDALAKVAGGQQGPVMQALKKYRLLAKQYPKTAGLVKSALIAVAGMASSGVAPIAIIGMLGTLDRALKGNTLFNSLVGGAADTALAGVSQAVGSALGSDATLTEPGNAGAQSMDMMTQPQDAASQDFQLPADSAAQNAQVDLEAARQWINADEATRADIEQTTGMSAAQLQDIAVSNDLVPNASSLAPGEEIVPPGGVPAPGAEGFGGGTYTVQAGDQGGYIAQANGVSFPDLKALNPQITNWNKLPIGTELQLPPANTHTGSVWDGSATGAPAVPATTTAAPTASSTTAATPAATTPVVPPAGPQYAKFRTPISSQGVKESINFKVIPAEQMIDQKLTVLNWALLESVNRKSNSISLTTKGVYTVFENVDRYRRAILEATDVAQGPGYNRLDMPNAPVTPDANPGMIGKGLNWLDKTAGKVGSWLGNKAHQLTTGITKDKLKIKWQQDGEPLDSDQLATWLVSKGVPQQVVSDVYGKMGIPYTAPARAYKGMGDPTGAVNLKTGVPYTGDELQAMTRTAKVAKDVAADPEKTAELMGLNRQGLEATAAAELSPQATTSVSPTATPAQPTTAAAASTFPGEDPQGPNYIGRREVAKRQAARAAAQTAAPAKPNFAQQGGYAQVNQPTAVKYSGMPAAKPAAPAAPAAPRVTAGGPTPAERQALDKRIAAAAKAQPVAETVKQVKRMMETVTTKADVQRVKDYIDYHMGSDLTESARLKRNRLISEVTQLAATRRREIARQMAQ